MFLIKNVYLYRQESAEHSDVRKLFKLCIIFTSYFHFKMKLTFDKNYLKMTALTLWSNSLPKKGLPRVYVRGIHINSSPMKIFFISGFKKRIEGFYLKLLKNIKSVLLLGRAMKKNKTICLVFNIKVRLFSPLL